MSLRIPARSDFEVLWDGEDVMVVGKPAPLIMHPAGPRGGVGKSDEVTLLGVLKAAMPREEFFFVNRLDRETSGCVVVAKSGKAARVLGKMMGRREIKKGYVAVVQAWPEWDELRVDAPIRRRGEFEESEVWVRQGVQGDGKECLTNFKVRERIENRWGRFTVMECQPETGRTHQIRVHLEHVGFPMVGDKIYGGDDEAYLDFLREGWSEDLQKRLILDRQALHAEWVEFEWKGDLVKVRCVMPAELEGFCVA